MALGNPHIDYFSLDIEGAEFPVLKALPWDKINITLLDIEMNHAGKMFPGSVYGIRDFLSKQNFSYAGTQRVDQFFYNK